MTNTAMTAEIFAIRLRLILAKEKNWNNLILSSDSKESVDSINQVATPEMEMANIILDCRELKQQLCEMHLQFEGRRWNKLADVMAKAARHEISDFNNIMQYQQPYPSCKDLYEEELHGCMDFIGSVT